MDPATSDSSRMRSLFAGCAIGLNLHAGKSIGQMESFRMALFLSNKMCVVSESIDGTEMPMWDGLVRMPAAWKPDTASRVKSFKHLFSLVQELKENPVKLAECRQTSHELYKERFSGAQVLSNAGINATMLRSTGGKVLGLVGGLGHAPGNGLLAQLLALLGAVAYSHEHGIQYVSEDALQFNAGGNVTDGNFVRFGDLFNVTHWNARARGNQSLPLPLIVQENATVWTSAEAVSGRGHDASDSAKQVDSSSGRSVCWFWQSLLPANALLKVVDTVRPAGAYGVLHAPVEGDSRAPGAPPASWSGRTPLPAIYGRIASSAHRCLSRPDSLYVCAAGSGFTDPGDSGFAESEDASILKRRATPWPNISLELGGSEAVREAGLEGSEIQGAILDLEIARGAKFFLADEGSSTFARAIMTSRTCAGLPCNIDSRSMREASHR